MRNIARRVQARIRHFLFCFCFVFVFFDADKINIFLRHESEDINKKVIPKFHLIPILRYILYD